MNSHTETKTLTQIEPAIDLEEFFPLSNQQYIKLSAAGCPTRITSTRLDGTALANTGHDKSANQSVSKNIEQRG